jgi:RHS repeat-associated protein
LVREGSHPDHLNTPRAIYNDQQQLAWRWDQAEPFGNSPPNENPSGLGTCEVNLRFPGQYFDKETNLAYNYFRDYDVALGRYIESDRIGISGLLQKRGFLFDESRYQVLVLLDPERGSLRRHTYDGSAISWRSGSLSTNATDLYSYVDGSPVSRSDPRGELWPALIIAGAGLIGGGAVASYLYWLVKCLDLCNKYTGCPFPDNDENIAQRMQWLDQCKLKCAKAASHAGHAGTLGDGTVTRPPL